MKDATIHAAAVSQVEDALKLAGICISGFSGVTVHNLTDETSVGGELLPAGSYTAVDVRVLVPVTALQ